MPWTTTWKFTYSPLNPQPWTLNKKVKQVKRGWCWHVQIYWISSDIQSACTFIPWCFTQGISMVLLDQCVSANMVSSCLISDSEELPTRTLAAGLSTCSDFRMVAPSFITMTPWHHDFAQLIAEFCPGKHKEVKLRCSSHGCQKTSEKLKSNYRCPDALDTITKTRCPLPHVSS